MALCGGQGREGSVKAAAGAESAVRVKRRAFTGSSRLCPVSYTHLDVYKRQALDTGEAILLKFANHLISPQKNDLVKKKAPAIGTDGWRGITLLAF